jgi:hypothetical protein
MSKIGGIIKVSYAASQGGYTLQFGQYFTPWQDGSNTTACVGKLSTVPVGTIVHTSAGVFVRGNDEFVLIAGALSAHVA